MRFLALLLAGCIANSAYADRLISIPTGRKLPEGTLRLEAMSELSRGRSQEYFLGYGLSPFLEIEFRSEYFEGGKAIGTFDLAYNFISPVPDISPGLSVGVQDCVNNSRDGRRFYTAFTLRPTFETINGDVPSELTIGFFLGSHSSPFVGGTIPFARQFRFLYEFNGIRLAAGAEIRPFQNLGIRLIARDQDVLGDLQFTKRF